MFKIINNICLKVVVMSFLWLYFLYLLQPRTPYVQKTQSLITIIEKKPIYSNIYDFSNELLSLTEEDSNNENESDEEEQKIGKDTDFVHSFINYIPFTSTLTLGKSISIYHTKYYNNPLIPNLDYPPEV